MGLLVHIQCLDELRKLVQVNHNVNHESDTYISPDSSETEKSRN